MVLETQIEQALSTLFPEKTAENGALSDPESMDPSWSVYPEKLLHATEKGNKYYVAFQSLTRQFHDGDKTGASAGSIVQFGHSKMSALLRQKVNFWDDKEHENEILDSGLDLKLPILGVLENTAASSLFSWSSGDKYIAARKKELLRKSVVGSGMGKSNLTQPEPFQNGSTQNTRPSNAKNSTKDPKSQRGPNFTHRLTAVVEKESNRFIQDRIRLIKDHHVQQAAKKIDDRRKRDHEMQLRRVQLKEEKYENILKAAIAVQNTKRNSGFFGSLFGPKPISNSFTLEITNAEVPMEPTKPQITPSPSLVQSENMAPSKPLEPHEIRPSLEASEHAILLPSSGKSSFELEFEAYQSSTDKTAITQMDGAPGAGPQWNVKHGFEENPHTLENLLDGSFLDFEIAPAPQFKAQAPAQAQDTAPDLVSL